VYFLLGVDGIVNLADTLSLFFSNFTSLQLLAELLFILFLSVVSSASILIRSLAIFGVVLHFTGDVVDAPPSPLVLVL